MAELRRERGANGPAVSGFRGRALLVDGVARAGGVILTPTSATDWDGVQFNLAADMTPPPEFILFGSGSMIEQPDRHIVTALEARGIGVEVMDTRAAARAWSLLRGEDRWISAALRAL